MAKPRGRYKDSGKVTFKAEVYFAIPRRKLKKLFDLKKAAILSDMDARDDDRGTTAKVRKLSFEKFLAELESQFQCAYDEAGMSSWGEQDLLDWADEEFEQENL